MDKVKEVQTIKKVLKEKATNRLTRGPITPTLNA